jgi:predicted transcriptional regulator YdeE
MLYTLLNVKKDAPTIVTLTESIKMIGVSARMTPKTVFRDSQILGQRYNQVKTAGLVHNKKSPWAFVAISKDFSEDGAWDYLMGDVVTDLENVPDKLLPFEIPAGTYAKFSLQPRSVALWGFALGMLKKFIYTEWLPNSNYLLNNQILGDFEYHDQRSLAKKPEIDLYVSIKEK